MTWKYPITAFEGGHDDTKVYDLALGSKHRGGRKTEEKDCRGPRGKVPDAVYALRCNQAYIAGGFRAFRLDRAGGWVVPVGDRRSNHDRRQSFKRA